MCCTVRCDHRLHDAATVLRETVVYLLVPTLAHRVPVLHLVRGRVGGRAGVRLRLRLRLWLRLQVRVRFQLRVRVGARARARARVRVGRVPALHRGYSRHAPRVHLCDGRRRARRRAAMLRRRARRRRPRARRHARRGGRGARSSAEAPAAVQAWGAQVCMRSTVGQALVHVPRTSRTWAPCASCPAPRVRAARRRPVRIRHSYGTATARLRHGCGTACMLTQVRYTGPRCLGAQAEGEMTAQASGHSWFHGRAAAARARGAARRSRPTPRAAAHESRQR